MNMGIQDYSRLTSRWVMKKDTSRPRMPHWQGLDIPNTKDVSAIFDNP